ncbi:MAG: hypothetical protein LBK73_08725 [Treponema sp.]|jgi:ATP-dependent DNA helicase DinG|nr:hypothetical protein [Treponema sp.]
MTDADYPKIAAPIDKRAAPADWFRADAHPGDIYRIGRANDILQEIFGRVMPRNGFKQRGDQTDLAMEILANFCERGILLAEAEVGIGKTLAYLIPAVITRRARLNEGKTRSVTSSGYPAPIVVATSSIALQRAIICDYIPALSDILTAGGIIGAPLTAALRKGKGNYLCRRRLNHFLQFADARAKKLLQPILDSNVVDLEFFTNLTPYIKSHISVDKICNKHCPVRGDCRYRRHIAAMNFAVGSLCESNKLLPGKIQGRGGLDFQVTNHNYLLADAIRRANGQPSLLQDYQAVVIDEAHKFSDAARGMYGFSLDYSEICDIMGSARKLKFEKGDKTGDIGDSTNKILSRSGKLFRYLNDNATAGETDGEVERYATRITDNAARLIRELRDNVSKLIEIISIKRVSESQKHRMINVSRELDAAAETLMAFARHSRLIYWLEERENAQSSSEIRLSALHGIPKNLGESLERHLWRGNIPIILTSGTLSAAGNFTRIKCIC